MPLVETSLGISRVVEFIFCDACIASLVEIGYKLINQVKEVIFKSIIVTTVQPIDEVAPHSNIVVLKQIIAYTCLMHCAFVE